MLPNVIFLGAFVGVVVVILGAVVVAVLRARRDLRAGKAEAIRWAEDFNSLLVADRACRHELTGEVAQRVCPNGFDCRVCETHPQIVARGVPLAPSREIVGIELPGELLYHRGHTWVHPEEDGTVTVGLDDFASRLMGLPDRVVLPARGASLEVNGTGWIAVRDGSDVRVLSPVDGEVVATGGPSEAWYLRVRPPGGALDDRHLLRGGEVGAWMAREIDRLQSLIGNGSVGPSLADGGVLVTDLTAAIPDDRRDSVVGEMMMDG
jgi:hypothetical protein